MDKGLWLSVGGGSVRGVRLHQERCMTDHAQVVRKYVEAVDAVSVLFGPDRCEMVNFREFSVAMQLGVLATADYVASLKEQGFVVPYGLEERNRAQAGIYFPHGFKTVD